MERTNQQQRYDLLGPMVVEKMKNRFFDAYYVRTSAEAKELVLQLIPANSVVSWGGSETLLQIGLLQHLRGGGYSVIDRDTAQSADERIELMRKALLCDVFLMSANAISEDGQLFNIDGNGNRVAALCYGPRSVVVVAGLNKVCQTTEQARLRARTIAAPINVCRFKSLKTACSHTGACADCLSADSACAQFVRTRICRPANRIKVILVGEDLGF